LRIADGGRAGGKAVVALLRVTVKSAVAPSISVTETSPIATVAVCGRHSGIWKLPMRLVQPLPELAA